MLPVSIVERMKPDRSRAGSDLQDAVLRTWRDRGVGDEESFHCVQIYVAAELIGAEIKHGEIVAAGGEKRIHRHAVGADLSTGTPLIATEPLHTYLPPSGVTFGLNVCL